MQPVMPPKIRGYGTGELLELGDLISSSSSSSSASSSSPPTLTAEGLLKSYGLVAVGTGVAITTINVLSASYKRWYKREKIEKGVAEKAVKKGAILGAIWPVTAFFLTSEFLSDTYNAIIPRGERVLSPYK